MTRRPNPLRPRLSAAIALLLGPISALAEPPCTLRQITSSTDGDSAGAQLDGGSIAFSSTADLTGENRDGSVELFLFDGSAITQITHSVKVHQGSEPSLDEGKIAFTSSDDLTGDNPDGNSEIFLWDGSSMVQITDSTDGPSFSPSLDGDSIAFSSWANLTGENPNSNMEIFLFDGSTISQVTHSKGFLDQSYDASLDGEAIAFVSYADLTGENPGNNFHIFLFDGTTISQISGGEDATYLDAFAPSLDDGSIAFYSNEIYLYNGTTVRAITRTAGGILEDPSLHGHSVAFVSDSDLTGQNPERNVEVFLAVGSTIVQVTKSSEAPAWSFAPSLDGTSIAFESNADFTGENPDHNFEIFLATCPVLSPPPPPGQYLASDELPGFRFKVRITGGSQAVAGSQEPNCPGETLCVSGALPGRSELFLRVIGPRPNGLLWVNLVRFTPSRVEVWAEKLATGEVNYYDLPALERTDDTLTGLIDRDAFQP